MEIIRKAQSIAPFIFAVVFCVAYNDTGVFCFLAFFSYEARFALHCLLVGFAVGMDHKGFIFLVRRENYI
jgi:cytochrome c biogenesis protein CcdA